MSEHSAVIFDLGGVVLGSPLHAIAAYERELGIPAHFINRVVMDTAPDGAWSRLERGELSLEEFYRDFDAECEARGHLLPAADMMEAIRTSSGPLPEMLGALERLREYGLTTAALTNNWKSDGQDRHGLRPYFDVFIESSVEGLRKPDPAIYRLACERLEVTPEEMIFLDDIGGNLKPAQAMGMATIKVDEPAQALSELSALVGFAFPT